MHEPAVCCYQPCVFLVQDFHLQLVGQRLQLVVSLLSFQLLTHQLLKRDSILNDIIPDLLHILSNFNRRFLCILFGFGTKSNLFICIQPSRVNTFYNCTLKRKKIIVLEYATLKKKILKTIQFPTETSLSREIPIQIIEDVTYGQL